MSDIKLFISHTQKDEALADQFVQLINKCLVVTSNANCCFSVQGYALELRTL